MSGVPALLAVAPSPSGGRLGWGHCVVHAPRRNEGRGAPPPPPPPRGEGWDGGTASFMRRVETSAGAPPPQPSPSGGGSFSPGLRCAISEPQHRLGDDVALDLVRSAVDGGGAAVQVVAQDARRFERAR